jgi:hypothetical protein
MELFINVNNGKMYSKCIYVLNKLQERKKAEQSWSEVKKQRKMVMF